MTIERLFLKTDSIPGHLIIATGCCGAMRIEAFNWQNEDNPTCDLPDYPMGIYQAVPVTIKEKNYVCGGGYPYTAHCFNLLSGEKAPFNLFHKRAYASSVTTNDTVFIFGGSDGSGALASYETINVDLAHSEGVLPFTWYSGCSTLINSTTILLVGGYKNEKRTEETWFFNIGTKEWTQGPSMVENRNNFKARENFGCGLIKSINSVAAFGGYYPYTATTEIVKLPGGSFKPGNHQFSFD